ncbi:MAG: hypothetical protein AAGI03_14695 [Pseudomonadota bacterium]
MVAHSRSSVREDVEFFSNSDMFKGGTPFANNCAVRAPLPEPVSRTGLVSDAISDVVNRAKPVL